ncbi:ankyrin repeat-containing domain protein [Aspergillus venezuelensis]
MEAVGLVVGVVGLLPLYDEAAKRVRSFRHFGSETLQLSVRYNTNKTLFENWGKHAGIGEGASEETVHPLLKDKPTADAAMGLPTVDQPGSTRSHFSSHVKWALAGSRRLPDLVDAFDELVGKLYDLLRELKESLIKSQRSSILDRVVRWFDAPFTDGTFDACCTARLDTTCHWITGHPSYCQWLADDFFKNSNVLWVHGPAGFGKSVLSKFPVCYAFCSAKNDSQSSPISILRSWILQCVLQYDLITSKATQSDLWKLLNLILPHRQNATFLNIDVLREIMVAMASHQVRLLVVSREEGDIGAEIGPHARQLAEFEYYSISITRNLVARDIDRFARHVVAVRLPQKPDEFRQDIAGKMAKKCDGMFLWIRLQSTNLGPRKGNKQLQRILNDMPTDLNSSPSERTRAETILRWVAFARIPLDIVALSEVVSVLDDEDDEPCFDNLPEIFDEAYVESEILGACILFLELRSDDPSHDWKSHRIHLVRASASEFLLSVDALSNPPWQHSLLASACLKYLDHRDTWDYMQHQNYERINPIHGRLFGPYASVYWPEHVLKSQAYRDRTHPRLLHFFKVPNSNWEEWRAGVYRMETLDQPAEYRPGKTLPGTMGNADVLMFLLEQEADMTVHGEYGSALHAAAVHNETEAASVLLEHGAATLTKNTDGAAPLFLAAVNGDLEVAQVLVAQERSLLDVSNDDGLSPLHVAAMSGDTKMVQFLVDSGAELHTTHSDIFPPLVYLASNDAGADPNFPGENDITALHTAAGPGCNIETILSADELTPLHYATIRGSTDATRVLLEYGTSIPPVHPHNHTPLHFTADSGHIEVVDILLRFGADVSTSASIESGADVNIATFKGYTPLYLACKEGHTEVARLLIERGSDTNRASTGGMSPLCVASNHNHLDVVRLLVQEQADVNHSTRQENTPLSLAAGEGYVEVARVLIDRGANVNKATTDGLTPLCIASGQNHLDVVQLLVQANALNFESFGGRFLTADSDHLAAILAFNNCISIDTDTEEVIYGEMCTACRASPIRGRRYVCTSCANCDLCAVRMERYGESEEGQCVGHEFLCIPSDDWQSEECTDVYTREFLDWVRQITLKHKPAELDGSVEIPIIGLGEQPGP